MPAYGWHNEALLLSTHHWLEYEAFIHIINGFKFKSFSVKASRDLMRTTLENLPRSLSFSTSTRFPVDAIFIDLHHSVPMRTLRTLTMALDYSDRQTEKARDRSYAIDSRNFSNMEDAKVAFYSAVDQLLDLVGPMPIEQAHVYGVYLQNTFEHEHNLAWT